MSTRRYGNFDSSNSNALLQFLSGPNLSHTPLAHSLTPYTHLACSILTHTHTHTNTHTCTHTPLTHSLTPHINLTCLFLTCTNIPLAHCALAHSKGHVRTSHTINPHTHTHTHTDTHTQTHTHLLHTCTLQRSRVHLSHDQSTHTSAAHS